MIPVIRALDPAPGITTQVGGSAATGHDFLVLAGRARAVGRRR